MSSTPSTAAASSPAMTSDVSPPQRFIYTEKDMDAFKVSPAKRELLRLVQAMGKSCSSYNNYTYDPRSPLTALSPAMASLYGSLRNMQGWLEDIPPDDKAKARFGNPAFRVWHARLVERSRSIVLCLLKCHKNHGRKEEYEASILEQCSNDGFRAASAEPQAGTDDRLTEEDESVFLELRTYLHDAFGHPTRLDYGTGHESSFMVFLYALCKLGCFGNASETEPPTPTRLKATTLSIITQYLKVTRGLQTDYMLEPAGSHGVWGLDDYHCLPFYFGACQLIPEVDYTPQSIHDNATLLQLSDSFMYFGCIQYIKNLKKGVPFFESSPILNDISDLPTWHKVSSGLLRLYEGEVLDKRQVVQHFVFGRIFKATWTPSEHPREAPKQNFVNGPGGAECIAPWATEDSDASGLSETSGLPPPTRAPWAK